MKQMKAESSRCFSKEEMSVHSSISEADETANHKDRDKQFEYVTALAEKQ
jgi:hypothetical protein